MPQQASSASALPGQEETQSSPQGDGARLAPGPGEPQHASSASALQGQEETQPSPQGEGVRFAQEQPEPEEAQQDPITTDPASLCTRYFPAREALVEDCPWRVVRMQSGTLRQSRRRLTQTPPTQLPQLLWTPSPAHYEGVAGMGSP